MDISGGQDITTSAGLTEALATGGEYVNTTLATPVRLSSIQPLTLILVPLTMSSSQLLMLRCDHSN